MEIIKDNNSLQSVTVSLEKKEIDRLRSFVENGTIIKNLINKSMLDQKGVGAEKLLLQIYKEFVVDVRTEALAKCEDITSAHGISYNTLLREKRLREKEFTASGESVIFELPAKYSDSNV